MFGLAAEEARKEAGRCLRCDIKENQRGHRMLEVAEV
jgi:hypothetical protein